MRCAIRWTETWPGCRQINARRLYKIVYANEGKQQKQSVSEEKSEK